MVSIKGWNGDFQTEGTADVKLHSEEDLTREWTQTMEDEGKMTREEL